MTINNASMRRNPKLHLPGRPGRRFLLTSITVLASRILPKLRSVIRLVNLRERDPAVTGKGGNTLRLIVHSED